MLGITEGACIYDGTGYSLESEASDSFRSASLQLGCLVDGGSTMACYTRVYNYHVMKPYIKIKQVSCTPTKRSKYNHVTPNLKVKFTHK